MEFELAPTEAEYAQRLCDVFASLGEAPQGLIDTRHRPAPPPPQPHELEDDEDRLNAGLSPLPRPNSHFNSSLGLIRPKPVLGRAENGSAQRYPPGAFGPPLRAQPSLQQLLRSESPPPLEEITGDGWLVQVTDRVGRIFSLQLPSSALLLCSPATYSLPAMRTFQEAKQSLTSELEPGLPVSFSAIPVSEGVFSAMSMDWEAGRRKKIREAKGRLSGALEDWAFLAVAEGSLAQALLIRDSLWSETEMLDALEGARPRRRRSEDWLRLGARLRFKYMALPRELRELFSARKGGAALDGLILSAEPCEEAAAAPAPARARVAPNRLSLDAAISAQLLSLSASSSPSPVADLPPTPQPPL